MQTKTTLVFWCTAAVTTLATTLAVPALAQGGGRFCTATAGAQYDACGFQNASDHLIARAKCINVTDDDEREDCFALAKEERDEQAQLCSEQRDARRQLCETLGEGRFDPEVDPADFDSDFRNLTHPNPYFPLVIGYRWDYVGSGDETDTIQVLDKTKSIEGVTCIVVNDRVFVGGELVEDTDDWHAQRKDGTVDYCGESVRNYETFPGDQPPEPELVDVHGQWKAGRDRDPFGTFSPGSATVGQIFRQEWSPENAEDVTRVLSTSYGFGHDPDLDEHVPRAVVDLLCAANDCRVTRETTPIEPDVSERKYYARGIGWILTVNEETGEVDRIVGCNFDSRCATLPQP